MGPSKVFQVSHRKTHCGLESPPFAPTPTPPKFEEAQFFTPADKEKVYEKNHNGKPQTSNILDGLRKNGVKEAKAWQLAKDEEDRRKRKEAKESTKRKAKVDTEDRSGKRRKEHKDDEEEGEPEADNEPG